MPAAPRPKRPQPFLPSTRLFRQREFPLMSPVRNRCSYRSTGTGPLFGYKHIPVMGSADARASSRLPHLAMISIFSILPLILSAVRLLPSVRRMRMLATVDDTTVLVEQRSLHRRCGSTRSRLRDISTLLSVRIYVDSIFSPDMSIHSRHHRGENAVALPRCAVWSRNTNGRATVRRSS